MKDIFAKFSGIPIILAPMEDVTDIAYRKICKYYGADILYTEFVSSDALSRQVFKSKEKIKFDEEDRPIAVQIFGSEEKAMVEAAQIAQEYNPNFIDINWGCPVKKIVSKGAGSAILKDIPKMISITKAIVKSVSLPVTVKTRLGWDETSKPIVEVALRLQDAGIQSLTIHGRTRSQLYSGKADWSLITQVKKHHDIEIPIIGNGDIYDEETAAKRLDESGVDALMIGRAAIGNPWIFNRVKHYIKTKELLPPITVQAKAEVCIEHLKKSIEYKGELRAILEMRKHYSNYFKSVTNFKQTKIKLISSKDLKEILDILTTLKES